MDEIAELPTDLQARLLRVLQEGTFSPVGQTESIEVDVRLISATHQSLRDAVERGEFREDLMYRIRVVPLFLPRLADRDGDVEALLARFVGVGDKVADCVLLFSLDFLEAVPLDTWIRTAIAEHYPECDRGAYDETSRAIRDRFGPYAGYAQTYVFHHLRHGRRAPVDA